MKISSKIKTAIVAASALSMMAIAAPASAGVVTFKNTNGTWTNPVGGSNVKINNGTDEITWGYATSGNKKSGFDFDALNVGSFNLTDGGQTNMFNLAEFEHNNYKITGNAITSVDLKFNTDIWVDGAFVENRTFTWTFDHTETPNNNPWWGGNCCADTVSVAFNDIGGNSFQVGNDLYTLDLGGFYAKKNNKWVETNAFTTEENSSNVGKIRGRLSMTTLTSAVPEPATWAMMLVGFFGAGSMLRTTRRKELLATAA